MLMSNQGNPDPAVLTVKNLEISLTIESQQYSVVSDMALKASRGKTVCIVGESGCGKSLTALSLMGLLPSAARVTGGKIDIDGISLLELRQRDLEDLRGRKIAMIFQDPLTALNPVMTIGDQIAEAVIRHLKISRGKAQTRVLQTLEDVQMPAPEIRAKQFPHELSGGMRQRAVIALALSCEPDIIVADEPTTALDVTIQAQILGLLLDLQKKKGLSLILITHDLGVVSETADQVIVMYAGRRVEVCDIFALFDNPLHPYTRGLMGAIPNSTLNTETGRRLADISGTVPPIWDLPAGCAFAPRCTLAKARCHSERPPLALKESEHKAACWEVADAR
jgi:peptide/nickel transport system ATP-binding protein